MKHPAARAAIGIVAVPLVLMFALAVIIGSLAVAGLAVVLSLGFVAAVLIAMAVLIPVVTILAVIAGAVSTPFRRLNRRRKK